MVHILTLCCSSLVALNQQMFTAIKLLLVAGVGQTGAAAERSCLMSTTAGDQRQNSFQPKRLLKNSQWKASLNRTIEGAGNSWNLMSPLCHFVYPTQLRALPVSVAFSNLIHLCHHPGPHAGPNLG